MVDVHQIKFGAIFVYVMDKTFMHLNLIMGQKYA